MKSMLKSVLATLVLAVGALACSPAHAFDLIYASGAATSDGGYILGTGGAVGTPKGAIENVSIAFFSLNATPGAYGGTWFPGTIKLSGGPNDVDFENVTPFFVYQYTAAQLDVIFADVTWNGRPAMVAVTLWHASPGQDIVFVELLTSHTSADPIYWFAGALNGAVIY